MLQNKKLEISWKVLLILLPISIACNILLIYLLIDTSYTLMYKQMDQRQSERERENAIQLLNLVIKSNPRFDFNQVKEQYLKENLDYASYNFPEKNSKGYLFIDTICFQKIGTTLHASYCYDLANPSRQY